MKKAFIQTLMVFVIGHIIIVATYNLDEYSNYLDGEATVVETSFNGNKYLTIEVDGKILPYNFPYIKTFILLNVGDKIKVKYKVGPYSIRIIHVIICSPWLNLITADKIVLKSFFFMLMFGILWQIYRKPISS